MKTRAKRPTPRGYSTEFKPKGKGERYLLDRIPEALWQDVKYHAKRDRVSIRAAILKLLRDWVDTPF